MSDAIEFSRPSAVAAALGDEGSQRFLTKRVLLRGDATVLLSQNGHEAFRAAFLLLIRICQNVVIALPTECGGLHADITALAGRFIPGRRLALIDPPADFYGYDAILSVGTSARADLPWTVIHSDGWLARVSSRGCRLPDPGAEVNAIGAVGAACLGVGEVFKRLIGLRSNRGELLDVTAFSFWTYRTDDDAVGPPLDPLVIDVLLIGCGAIGSGTAYLLSRLPVSGRAFALDRQRYGLENFGTSIIVGPDDYNRPKAEVTAEMLQPKLDARPLFMDIASFQAQYDRSYPDIVLAGLDDVEPRHQVQQLWPGLIVDGAVGGELSCQVSCHPWGNANACLLCLFQKQETVSLADLNARATGLPPQIANNPDAIITEEAIAVAQEGRRDWLRSHLGKRVCSVTSAAAVAFLSSETYREGFAPAVPFVSCFSACMITTELVRYLTLGTTLPAPRYQLNFLWGPRRGAHYEEDRHRDCFCSERAINIAKLRRLRGR
jgi:molybdopterin/thiamine biosynthesis adenylyltransferase